MNRYREKDTVSNVWNVATKDLEFIEYAKSHLILVFMLYLRHWVIRERCCEQYVECGVFHEMLLHLCTRLV